MMLERKAENIFDKRAGRNMINYNKIGFINTYPNLHKTIIKSIVEALSKTNDIIYVLIRVTSNNNQEVEISSSKKEILEKYLSDKGFLLDVRMNKYIDDKSSGINGGSGTDYIIKELVNI